jgi:hypothetical protein
MDALVEDLAIMEPVEKHNSEQVAHQQVLDGWCRCFRLEQFRHVRYQFMIAVPYYLIFDEHFLALGDLFGKVYHLEILVVPIVFLGLFSLHSFFLVIIRLSILIISYVLI